MNNGVTPIPAPRPRGNIVIRKANGDVRLSPHMEANPQDIPDWIVNEMPEQQKRNLGLCQVSQS